MRVFKWIRSLFVSMGLIEKKITPQEFIRKLDYYLDLVEKRK